MRFPKTLILAFIISLVFSNGSFRPPKEILKVAYIWEDEFSAKETQQIETWLSGVSEAIAQSFGAYPFTVKLYIHRTSGREPVPWAETSRSGEQAVHFHIDPGFALKDFQKDWTAAHELSHLSIPFIGRSNMWFSEGYASYWQWQVLQQQGIYTAKEIQKKYSDKLKNILPYYNSNDSFIEVSGKLKKAHNYSALYWGGACYFFQVDALLKQDHNSSLREVIRKYQNNGRLTDDSLEDLISSLDEISKSTVFSEMLYAFQKGSAKDAVLPTKMSLP